MKRMSQAMTAGAVVALGVFLSSAAALSQGFTQGDDPLLVTPQVLVIVDTSGSMAWGNYPCGEGSFNCNRQTALREVLTGTYLESAGSCRNQKENGILDAYSDSIRFGFASFDDDRGCGCSYCTGASQYNYPDWGKSDSTGTGGKLGIKGRNDTGGRLIDLVDPTDPDNLLANNLRVQEAACTTNATGCTPLNAALFDARYYFENWHQETGYVDPLADCRSSFVLLLTDGENNGPRGFGYGTPVEEAAALYAMGIPVYVVGFGAGMEVYVNPIAQAGSGGKLDAFIAQDPSELFESFSAVLDAILTGAASRTAITSAPSHLSYEESYAYSASFQISTGGFGWQGYLFRTRVADDDGDGTPEFTTDQIPFHRKLEAQPAEGRKILTVVSDPRSAGFSYPDQMPRPESNDPAVGLYPFKSGYDDSNPWMCLSAGERKCLQWRDLQICEEWQVGQECVTWGPAKLCSRDRDCTSPYMCNSGRCRRCDRLQGNFCRSWGNEYERQCLEWRDTRTCTRWQTVQECEVWDDVGGGVVGLANAVKDFVRGVPGTPARGGGYVAEGPKLGDIFHSDPVVVPPPSALSPDYRFEAYFRENHDRHTMVYVGANDGMLHAFVGEDNQDDGIDETGRELWAFIPNNLLANIQKARWGHYFFVDSTPVVRDVYFNGIQATDLDGKPMFQGGKPVMGGYRTVLVCGERSGGDAYFALDVTDPKSPRYLWEYRTEVPVSVDYQRIQCLGGNMQTWAKPIIGQVWLKLKNPKADENPFVARTVVIVPGGYMPPPALQRVSSCIEFVEMMVGAASLHIVDIETGKLLKRFLFSSSVTSDVQALLDEFYAELAANPDQNWNRWGAGQAFSGEGWLCQEKRSDISETPYLPAELLEHCEEYEDDLVYRQSCCYNPSTPPGERCNANGLTTCYYFYQKKKNVPGGLTIELKTEGCELVPPEQRGRFALEIEDDYWVESVNSTPAAYNTNFGEFITRVFVPTSLGKVWRVDVGNGLLDREAQEGNLVQAYTDGGVKYQWDVSRENDVPVPWFDTYNLVAAKRPIMVQPTLALNYQRNLVLFFGTGVIDTLEYQSTTDYFFAVEETRSEVDQEFSINPKGKLFGPQAITFGVAERLFGKPLVVAGKLVLTTYTPSSDKCQSGDTHIYMYPFDDFSPDKKILEDQTSGKGTPSPPTMVWTSQGPKVVVQQSAELSVLPVGEAITPAAHVLHWGKVL